MSPFHPNVVPLRQPAPLASVQGTLALDLGVGYPDEATEPPPMAAVPSPGTEERDHLTAWAHRFTQAAVEIAGGDRPVTQLLRWTTPRVYEDLGRRAQLVRAAISREPATTRLAQMVRPQVASLHTCWLDDTTAEVGARVRYGRRFRAVAVRFEHRGGRWQAVALEFA